MKILIGLIISIVASQIIKVLVDLAKKRFEWKTFLADGGFPSSHSAVVSCLTLSVFFEEGYSIIFFACLVFSLIVINDSFRVRKETGDQAKVLNKIIVNEKLSFPKLLEREGHTKGQVFAGIILGLLVTIIVYVLF